MSETEINQNIVKSKRDMVALSEAAAAKIDKWIEQINAKKTVSLSRKSFLSWYIENAPDNLSGGEVNAAIDTFYDTEAHLRRLLRDVRRAKASGLGDGGIDLVLRTKKAEIKRETGEDGGSGEQI
jgi:hypothetical protein